MIDDIQYLSPLGKSDHCVLFNVICQTKKFRNYLIRKNYNKTTFEENMQGLGNL